MVADALITVALVLGPEKGYSLCKKLEGVGCLIIEKEGKVILSPGLRGRISFNPFR
jgi:thiamine biosynthesis lipoprotein ApbE